MKSERKCHACGKWTSGDKTHCDFCNALIDPELIAIQKSEEREKIFEEEAKEKESKTVKKIKALKQSEKLSHRIMYYIFDTIFTIYMAILTFLVWLIALITA